MYMHIVLTSDWMSPPCRMLRWVTVPWVWVAGVYALYGARGLPLWALQAFAAVVILDLATYLECVIPRCLLGGTWSIRDKC